ncbi:hypothetical protein [Parapedobacter koreensis]|nr:hypothetical protein [Parapedobacter koreensis]
MTLAYILLQAINQTAQPTVTIWTVIAVAATIISAFSAYQSRGFAKKSYELAQQNYGDRQADFSLYLHEAYRWSTQAEPIKKILLFHVAVFNKSDSKSSFKADLEIEYIRDDDSVARVIIHHNENHKSEIPKDSISAFPNDIRVEERGMMSKWLMFEQPQNAFAGYRIDKYTIKVTDTQGNCQTSECSIIKEFANG